MAREQKEYSVVCGELATGHPARRNGMKHVSVCNVELNHMYMGLFRVLKDTMDIYRDACKLLGKIIEDEWESVTLYKTQKDKLSFVEHLTHKTKDNPEPKYPVFDQEFYKFPCYYRRAAINFCLGQCESYHSRMAKYEEDRYEVVSNGKRYCKRPPVLNFTTNACPALYKGQSFREDGNDILIKVRIRNTWDWVCVSIPSRDRKDLDKKRRMAEKVLSPTLVRKYHRFYLSFPIQHEHVAFPKMPLSDQVVLAIDLGINRGATGSVMSSDGTIHERIFDQFTCERDRLEHMLNRLRKVQARSGVGQSLAAFYTKLDGIKNNYVCKLAHWICEMAIKYNVYGVVFEHLGSMHGHGRKKDRIHHWCKRRIQELAKGMLLRNGIRTFFVNPRNTSALAYDGSGQVVRDKSNFSLCTFASGKRYNCDLSASYNIGARYYLRAIEKSMSVTAWSELTAKVPEFPKRTNYTLATLCAVSAAVWDMSKACVR